MNEFEIRKATEKDIPEILSMIKEFAAYNQSTTELEITEEKLKASLFGSPSYGEVILGFMGKQAVSYAFYLFNYSTLLGKPGLYLVDLYLRESSRKKDLGFKMMSYLAKIALENNCERLEGIVKKDNKSAGTFYEKIGGELLKEWDFYRFNKASLLKLKENNLKKFLFSNKKPS
jgi:GNAT superfamily N-acetyltransferase